MARIKVTSLEESPAVWVSQILETGEELQRRQYAPVSARTNQAHQINKLRTAAA